ncbi:zinc-dependent alcohol dehydrogenase family protein [Marivita geojedonensis]|nr:NAD(P)-dependent alcohol dehydrogenase [Marivita geojedonensis]
MELTDWTPDALLPKEKTRPKCSPDGVLIQMQAASLNYRDTVVVRRGYGRLTGSLPLIPVSDGAGVIIETGDIVTDLKPGDLVTPFFFQDWPSGPYSSSVSASALGGMRPGVMQEFMALPARLVAKTPKHFNAIQASTLPCAALTAWNAIVASGDVKKDDTVVVQGTGGVSLFALQFARMRQAKVILLSSDERKLEIGRQHGADHLINYRQNPDWSQIVREITSGVGASHIVEVGGAETLDQSLRSVAGGGTISLIGVLSGLKPALNLGPVVTQNIRLQGITVGSHAMHREMVQAIEEQEMEPVIDKHIFGFEEVGEAIANFGRRSHIGKVCIDFSR